jgi:hypothetical protein
MTHHTGKSTAQTLGHFRQPVSDAYHHPLGHFSSYLASIYLRLEHICGRFLHRKA